MIFKDFLFGWHSSSLVEFMCSPCATFYEKLHSFKPIYGEWFLAFWISANMILFNYVASDLALLGLFQRSSGMSTIRSFSLKNPMQSGHSRVALSAATTTSLS